MPTTPSGARVALAAEGSVNVATGLSGARPPRRRAGARRAIQDRARGRARQHRRSGRGRRRRARRARSPSSLPGGRPAGRSCRRRRHSRRRRSRSTTEPRLVTNADFSDIRVGGVATDVPSRFLAELAQAAGINLHVRVARGRRPAARARSDVQGGRRRARPGVPSRSHRRGGERVSKEVVRTEAAPGAVPGRAVLAGDQGERVRVRRRASSSLRPGDKELVGGRHRRADRAGLREPPRDPRGGRARRSTTS